MNSCKQYAFLCLSLLCVCTVQAWTRTGTITQKPTIANPDTMNQHLVVNVNFSPTQIQNPTLIPEKFLSKVPFKQWGNQTASFFHRNRYLLGASLVFSGYIAACNYAVQAHKFLERTDTWASWYSEISAEQLMAMDQKELSKELILEIQRRYSNPQNPTDFISPLIAFVQAVDKEILLLHNYITYYSWVHKLHVQGVLPIQQKLCNKADDAYKKIVYVKNIFLLWAANYKINHNKNKPVHKS